MKPFFPLVAIGVIVAVPGCKPARTEAPKAIPAVHLSKKVAESELATVTLTVEAERRLGVETAVATKEMTGLTRSYGGELILPLGRNDEQGSKSVFALAPAMTPADFVRTAQLQTDADGQVTAAKVQLAAAEVTLKRAEDLIASKAGVGRSVEEARAQVELARSVLRTAEERRALLGAPLFDAVRQKQWWVRVPVYTGELALVEAQAPAEISALGTGIKAARVQATPVDVPFSTGANALVSDLFYELKGEISGMRPGMKVSVTLPVQGREERMAVPAAAILYDFHGGTWVYENVGPQAYTRRRVEVIRVVAEKALLSRGLNAGAKIVAAGAAELFGTEFGAGK